MRLYRTKSSLRGFAAAILIFAAAILVLQYGFGDVSNANSMESLEITRTSVRRAIVNCYAMEGIYPPDIKYLENHYGLQINHKKYAVTYEPAGTNIMPSFQVQEIGTDRKEGTP